MSTVSVSLRIIGQIPDFMIASPKIKPTSFNKKKEKTRLGYTIPHDVWLLNFFELDYESNEKISSKIKDNFLNIVELLNEMSEQLALLERCKKELYVSTIL